MANIAPEFEVVHEFATLAHGLQERHPEIFDGIDIDKIRCVSITNKERGKKRRKLWGILPVKNPIRMDCPYTYYVIVYNKDWVELNEKMRLMMVADVLQSVPAEDDGKVLQPDMKEFSVMLRTFGVDFMENESRIPHLLNDKINWKT